MQLGSELPLAGNGIELRLRSRLMQARKPLVDCQFLRSRDDLCRPIRLVMLRQHAIEHSRRWRSVPNPAPSMKKEWDLCSGPVLAISAMRRLQPPRRLGTRGLIDGLDHARFMRWATAVLLPFANLMLLHHYIVQTNVPLGRTMFAPRCGFRSACLVAISSSCLSAATNPLYTPSYLTHGLTAKRSR